MTDEQFRVQAQVMVLAAVHDAVWACKNATGQHRVIDHFVNKINLANEVMKAFEDGTAAIAKQPK